MAVTAVILILVCLAAVWILNRYVTSSVENRIITLEEAADLEEVDGILVLGCYVYDDGNLSPMLRDRLIRGLEVYRARGGGKLLMSGDHGRTNYDEVNAMKHYAIDQGIVSGDVFMDHAGFSTYESLYRAKEVFQADKVIIVTQEYHLYRALYIAGCLGLEAYGVPADLNQYAGQSARDFREVLARCKDFIMCIIKPEPTYLGEAIPLSGDGDATNDEQDGE